MNRRSFLKFFGGAAVAAAIAPKIELFLEKVGPTVEVQQAISYATMAEVLKEIYGESLIKDLYYKDNPFLALVPRSDSWSGARFKIPKGGGE